MHRLRDQKHPIRFLLSRLLWRTGLSRFFTVDRSLYRVRFFPTSLSAALWLDPRTMRREERFFASYLRGGDVVVDVGANIGTSTLTAAAIVGDSGTVFSIEPHPVIFRYLQHLFNVAIGESKGIVSFSNKLSDDTQSQVVLGPGLEVQVEKLDDLLLPYKPQAVELLKVDVEGYEKYVFQGALETMHRTKCIFFECVERNFADYAYASTEVFDILRACGFCVYMMKGIGANRLAIRDLPSFLERMGNPYISEVV
jgi:FkbM family methyltransferase